MLNPGDIIFVGWDGDHDDVAFVTTVDVPAGEVIYFTDSEWNGSSFNNGEQLIEWVVPAGGIAAGSLMTLDMDNSTNSAQVIEGGDLSGPTSGTIDYIQGGGNLAPVNEMMWAFQGTRVGDDVTAENFISVIGNEADGGNNATPNLSNTGLTSDNGAIIIDGDHDYMVFDGFDALPDPLTGQGVIDAVSDTSNWTVDGGGRNGDDNNPLINDGFTNITPVRVYDETDVTTLYFSGDNVAFISDVSSSDSDVSTDLTVSEQPFLSTDVIEIDILNSSIRADGEFDFDEVIFTSVRVTRDGATYEFVVNDGSKVKESGAEEDESGQAIEQGDTFFITNDDVNSFVAAPLGFSPFAGVPSGQMAFALDAVFVDGGVTNIVREQGLVDGDGDPVGTINANFFTGLSELPPPPCFTRGTLIETALGSVAVEDLCIGDLVVTKDTGLQPVRWIGRREVPATGKLRPVVFAASEIGNQREMRVSQRHRMLVSGWKAELVMGVEEALVPARHMAEMGIGRICGEGGQVEYFHLLFDQHEIIFAEGVATESLDPAWLSSMASDDPGIEEVRSLFPEVFEGTVAGTTARPVARAFEAQLMLS
ncbi:hypothetical protein PH7735_02740 [Shimia thalassica]|uniref:Hedgehog/Intein (Hint) domain-containing protein n=1 Tax=Shimia thalassica TaxID=1715693 RepID=A0A0P1IBY8_9RHOB|nr:Hint domain-containing protein [Shimia thalassica]CUK04093.1 hypothetical protein PH7735_02740 [Shimia thalassica]